MLSDLEIAQNAKMKPIRLIAKKIGLTSNDIELYGNDKAKISTSALTKNLMEKPGKLILVSAINPTPAGEGKSTTTIGIGDSLSKLGLKTMICLREPSLGPVMGVKGGAAGGGYAQVVPMEDINLHFTGDLHAIGACNNLISAVIDNHLFQGNELRINPESITWKRSMDMNDRALRKIQVGLSSKKEVARYDGFDITVASEIMAVLCLSKDMEDLKTRLARIVIGKNFDGDLITISDLKVTGACAMLLRDAIKPNLVQTLENTPVLIHGGPFANIAHGCNSVIATNYARYHSDYVVTEAGFGADLGMEKFMDIKSRVIEQMPDIVVLVVSIRALKLHGGVLKENLKIENPLSVQEGIANLEKHIDSINQYHVPYILALNHFDSDFQSELDVLFDWAKTHHHPIAQSDVFAKGSKGGISLAKDIVSILEENNQYEASPIYDLSLPIQEKIKIIATKIYGADQVHYTQKALEQITEYQKFGWDKLAICMAKTPLSLSDDPKKIGRPEHFDITVREFKPSIGAGFIVALTGSVMTMPGLPKQGAYENMDVIDSKIIGLF